VTPAFDLKKARLDAGLSQRELAAATRAPLATIQGLEAGRGARPAHAKLVADFFDIKVTDLLPSEDSETPRAA
jgi:transcriptional regulator with XRE-family HTH domain